MLPSSRSKSPGALLSPQFMPLPMQCSSCLSPIRRIAKLITAGSPVSAIALVALTPHTILTAAVAPQLSRNE